MAHNNEMTAVASRGQHQHNLHQISTTINTKLVLTSPTKCGHINCSRENHWDVDEESSLPPLQSVYINAHIPHKRTENIPLELLYKMVGESLLIDAGQEI
jgi:hypothetical protein